MPVPPPAQAFGLPVPLELLVLGVFALLILPMLVVPYLLKFTRSDDGAADDETAAWTDDERPTLAESADEPAAESTAPDEATDDAGSTDVEPTAAETPAGDGDPAETRASPDPGADAGSAATGAGADASTVYECPSGCFAVTIDTDDQRVARSVLVPDDCPHCGATVTTDEAT